MVDLAEEIDIQKEFIEDTLQALQEAVSRKPMTKIELAAIATFVHNFYN